MLMADIALCLSLQGNFADARDMLLDTLAFLKKSSMTGTFRSTAVRAHSNLAVSLLALDNPAEAQAHVRCAFELLRTDVGGDLRMLPTMYTRAALLLCTQVRCRGCALVFGNQHTYYLFG
jgi:hypothetical protein